MLMGDYSQMDNQQFKQTKFDSMVTNKTMQLIKAVIPYIDNNMGTMIGMLIKLKELQNAAQINNNVTIAAMNADKHGDISCILEDIKNVLDDEEQENISNMMDMMEMFKMMSMDENSMNDFMNSAFMNSGFDNANFDFSSNENNYNEEADNEQQQMDG